MLRYYADLYYEMGCVFRLWMDHVDLHIKKTPKGTISNESLCLPAFKERTPAFMDLFIATGLKASARQLERIEGTLSDRSCRYVQLRTKLQSAHDVIIDELASNLFFCVPTERAVYYQEPNLFGQEVSDKFPESIVDIEEAGRCLALGRYTACVFHLMRVMERGVRYLGKTMRVPLSDEKTWDGILSSVQAKLNKMTSARKTKLRGKSKDRRDQYAAAVVHLTNVKNAWRNRVMHPKDTYTDEQAAEVFQFVKVYIAYLAREF